MWLLQLGFALALHFFLSVLGCEQHDCARWERCSWKAMLQLYLVPVSAPEVSRLFVMQAVEKSPEVAKSITGHV